MLIFLRGPEEEREDEEKRPLGEVGKRGDLAAEPESLGDAGGVDIEDEVEMEATVDRRTEVDLKPSGGVEGGEGAEGAEEADWERSEGEARGREGVIADWVVVKSGEWLAIGWLVGGRSGRVVPR